MRSVITLESPSVVIPWGIEEQGFLALIGAAATRVTPGHYRVRCTLLRGFQSEVHFHFKPRVAGRLHQLEITRTPSRHRKRAFEDLQARLELEFGPGQKLSPGPDDIAPCRWSLGQLSVLHDYYYQSGLYEKVLLSYSAA